MPEEVPIQGTSSTFFVGRAAPDSLPFATLGSRPYLSVPGKYLHLEREILLLCRIQFFVMNELATIDPSVIRSVPCAHHAVQLF